VILELIRGFCFFIVRSTKRETLRKKSKQQNMRFLFTIAIIILFFKLGLSQGSDYVIDVNDRKLFGTVKLSTPAINSSQIGFTDNKNGVSRKYRTDELKEWGKGNLIYKTKVYSVSERKSFSVFMRQLTPQDGKVHLYEYYNTNGDVGFTQTFLERDDKMTEVAYGRFRKQMTEYFKDSEELAKKISDKKFKKKDILDIIEEYNAWREYMWRH